MGDDERRQRVGLVLPGLPRHRRLLKVGQMARDAGGADFETLQQSRRPGQRITAAATAALGWPGRNADGVRRLGPAQSVLDLA